MSKEDTFVQYLILFSLLNTCKWEKCRCRTAFTLNASLVPYNTNAKAFLFVCKNNYSKKGCPDRARPRLNWKEQSRADCSKATGSHWLSCVLEHASIHVFCWNRRRMVLFPWMSLVSLQHAAEKPLGKTDRQLMKIVCLINILLPSNGTNAGQSGKKKQPGTQRRLSSHRA